VFLRISLTDGLIEEVGTTHDSIRQYSDYRDNGIQSGFRRAVLAFLGTCHKDGEIGIQIHLHHPERHGWPAVVYRPAQPDQILIGGCQEMSLLDDPQEVDGVWPTGHECLQSILANLGNYLEIADLVPVAA
jgi:hypothetical protein